MKYQHPKISRYAHNSVAVAAAIVLLQACAPVPGPDKSLAGGVLGAGWGAGAGAVIGHQLGEAGQGAGIGAGFGAASGLLTGIGLDMAEGTELEQQRQLDALKVQVASNGRALSGVQYSLDTRDNQIGRTVTSVQIFFDPDRASIRIGSANQLERLANDIKLNPYIGHIEIHSHSDDTGNAERNKELSEARAKTVQAFLIAHGVSSHEISVYSHSSYEPLASNSSDIGRQLNRRVEVVLKK